MRCDANISIRPVGQEALGTKVEVKNMNSIRNVRKAIEFEIQRLTGLVASGGTVVQETRSFDATNDTTFAIRTKERAEDYRYFAEPDLTPFQISDRFLEIVRNSLPALPEELYRQYTLVWNLPDYDARVISDDKELSLAFEALVHQGAAPKAAANWLLGPVKSYCNEQGLAVREYPLTPLQLSELIHLVQTGKLNFSTAASRVVPYMIAHPGTGALDSATAQNLIQESDEALIGPLIDEVLSGMPEKVKEYRKGKKGLVGLFVGEIIKRSKGKADPKVVHHLLEEKLKA